MYCTAQEQAVQAHLWRPSQPFPLGRLSLQPTRPRRGRLLRRPFPSANVTAVTEAVVPSSLGGYFARLDTYVLAAEAVASTGTGTDRREASGGGPTQGQDATASLTSVTSTGGTYQGRQTRHAQWRTYPRSRLSPSPDVLVRGWTLYRSQRNIVRRGFHCNGGGNFLVLGRIIVYP